jgi:hypothetical protein
MVDLIVNDYRVIAKDAWHRMYSKDSDPTAAFIENFILQIKSRIPTREDIYSSFSYRSVFYSIPVPSSICGDIALANEIMREDDRKTFELEREKDAKNKIREMFIQKKAEIVDDFLNSTVCFLRQTVAEICESVLNNIKEENYLKINKLNIQKLKNMIKKVESLNFYNDSEITCLLNEVNTEIEKSAGIRDNGYICDKLVEIVNVSKKNLHVSDFNPLISSLEI